VLGQFVGIFIRFFFLLTPFFVLSTFLALTQQAAPAQRRRVATRVTLAVVLGCLVLYFFGNAIFRVFGITVDAFRIGAGALLFLSAVSLVRGRPAAAPDGTEGDVAVVPLAIPITIGPATTGALLVMGAEPAAWEARLVGAAGLGAAALAVGAILHGADLVERLLGRRGIDILSKLTGLILAALAAQLFLSGVANCLAAADR
jgi:multiple antibiotic resistance protein